MNQNEYALFKGWLIRYRHLDEDGNIFSIWAKTTPPFRITHNSNFIIKKMRVEWSGEEQNETGALLCSKTVWHRSSCLKPNVLSRFLVCWQQAAQFAAKHNSEEERMRGQLLLPREQTGFWNCLTICAQWFGAVLASSGVFLQWVLVKQLWGWLPFK